MVMFGGLFHLLDPKPDMSLAVHDAISAGFQATTAYALVRARGVVPGETDLIGLAQFNQCRERPPLASIQFERTSV